MENPKRKVYIIAGEASGDLHGSNLMKAMLNEDPTIDFRFWGGDKMKAVAGEPVKHISELAFMGFVEVLANIRTILGNIKYCKEDIKKYAPDTLVLVDYPGFNLRIAEWAHENGIKVIYYISPQVWAWKQSRVHKIKKVVDHMYVILPFEKEFYQRFDFDVEYLGHPLLDEIISFEERKVSENEFRVNNTLDDRPIIAILPGSRKQEVSKKLPVMLEAIEGMSNYQFVVAGAPSLEASFYKEFLQADTKVIYGQTYELLSCSEAAIVTSGTATLETALFSVPEVVCYKSSKISYLIAKQLIKIKYISLVNLIMDKEVVKELIQDECNPKAIKAELLKIIEGGSGRKIMLEEFELLKKKLGGGGASQKVARSLLKTIH